MTTKYAVRGEGVGVVMQLFHLSFVLVQGAWGPFLERPGNLTGPKSYFEIKVSSKVGTR